MSLTRRLFRSGDSEYAINKKPCRLKDIIDLMADTGLGKGSMSIIGQNKIDEVLNSRPEERRALFEEAAGIAKYRLRKKDAVKKLDDTALNLTRISDIRSEVDAQVEPLAQAAAKTKRYNALSEELRLCRLSVLLRKLDNMAAIRAKLSAEKQAAADGFSQQAAILSGREAEAVALQRQLDRLAEDYSKLQEEIKNSETTLEKLRGRQGVLDERAGQSQRAVERLEQSNAKLAQQAAELEGRMQSLAAEYDAVDKARAKAALETERLQRERDAQAELLVSVQSQSASTQSEFFASMQELLKLRNELHALEQAQEQRMRRREALKKSIGEAEEEAAKSEEAYKRLLDVQSRCAHDAELWLNEAKALQADVEAAQSSIAQITEGQRQCQRKLAMTEAREQGLRRMQQAYEGFGYGVKAALKAQTPWRQQLLGVAAELITVEDKYITAVETALGEGAQNIVARSAEAAKAAIAYLKQTGGGRATFLPLDTVQGRFPSKDEEALTQMPGVCGFAMDLLQCRAEAKNALRFLLGRVLVAENIDAALAAARAARFRLRVVTLQGDAVNAGGSMTGGSRKQKEGYLSREADIKQLQEQLGVLRRETLSWQERLEAQEEAAAAQGRKLQSVSGQLQQNKLKSSEIKLRLEQEAQSRKRENERLALLLDDRSQVTGEYLANRDRLKEMRAAVVGRESRDAEAKARLEDLQRQIAKAESAVTSLENRLQDARVLLETSTAKSALMNERMQELDNNTLQVRRDIEANGREAQRLRQLAADCGAEKLRLQQQSDAELAELRRIMGGKEDFIKQRGELLLRQSDLEKETARARSLLSESEAALRQTELALARQESDYRHVLEQLAQDYQLTESEARQTDTRDLQHLDLKALQKQESKLALAISGLGPINAAAVEEYEAVKERSEFLRRQYDDLRTARDNLEAVIGEINSGMTKRFKEAFAEINVYFAKCYVKLFGGGTALLTLTDPDDLLNSGIEIEVQPPGKRLQSLYLMSGGERALTVIALLFALLSYQPSPFCILDEIDAPLDDANIQRFAAFLRDYSEQTQFIVITHRKGTMEAADIMYGVTMEESGVSKLLSVKINAKEN